MKVFEILENRDAIERMEEFILVQMRKVAKAEEQLEEARKRLTEAMQERKHLTSFSTRKMQGKLRKWMNLPVIHIVGNRNTETGMYRKEWNLNYANG